MTIYVHGGAWGITCARDYAALASRMARVFDGPVFVVDQRVWPEGDMRSQANDVADVVHVAQERYPYKKSVLVAHSAGAHSASIAQANGSTSVDVAVLQAVIYDLLAHYGHDAARGLETISPMVPAADADDAVVRLQDYSISKLFSSGKNQREAAGQLKPRENRLNLPLEGDREACHIGLPNIPERSVHRASWDAACGTFVMAAAEDEVVPLSSSLRFLKSLRLNGVHDAKLLLYAHTQLQDFVFDWIRNRTVNEGSLDIDTRDKTRRRMAFAVSHGKVAADLKEEAMQKDAPMAEHGRDLCRIIRAIVDI